MKKIVITFDEQGNSSIEAFGFAGTECLKATKSLEEALGKAGNRTMKNGGGGAIEQKVLAR